MDKRYARDPMEADGFVRHYEDVAHIIRAMGDLPHLNTTPAELGGQLVRDRVIQTLPKVTAPVLALADTEKREAVQKAYDKISPMFWGPRIALDDACGVIRDWVKRQGGDVNLHSRPG